MPRRGGPPVERSLPIIAGSAVALGVVGGLAVEGYLAMMQIPIPDQFDRLVNLLAGGLLGFLAHGALNKIGPNENVDMTGANVEVTPTPPVLGPSRGLDG